MRFHYEARVTEVVDGDTIYVAVDQGLDNRDRRIKTRLFGINAPEVTTAAGKVSREVLRTLLPVGTPVEVLTIKDKTEKYGRYLATVFCTINGVREELNLWLVTNGYAAYQSYAHMRTGPAAARRLNKR